MSHDDANQRGPKSPKPVVGRWVEYRFAEAPLPEGSALKVVPTPALPAELPPLVALDPGLELLNAALERQLARTPVAPIDYARGRATSWLLASPFELFLEHVLARKLGTVE
jgi:hypothetical protein